MGSETQRGPTIAIPALALVVIAGDSDEIAAFVSRWFAPDEAPCQPTSALDERARSLIGARLAGGNLTVAQVTEATSDAAVSLARLARQYDVAPVALLLGGARAYAGRFPVGPHGFAVTHEVALSATVTRVALSCDHRDERAPFDIIGDVHGCYAELIELLGRLGYVADDEVGMRPPDGRRVVFVGDLVDRGPGVVETVRLAMRMVAAGVAFCVPGNHDDKLARALMGRNVWVAHGLRESLEQIDHLSGDEAETLTAAYLGFVGDLPPYLVLDGGALVVAHAGLPERYHGRVSGRIRSLVLYGESLGDDVDGLPIRVDWAADYHGAAAVVYGHTPQREAVWRNNTINCDTGCVFGGALTAVRWPERAIIGVAARREYARRARPL